MESIMDARTDGIIGFLESTAALSLLGAQVRGSRRAAERFGGACGFLQEGLDLHTSWCLVLHPVVSSA